MTTAGTLKFPKNQIPLEFVDTVRRVDYLSKKIENEKYVKPLKNQMSNSFQGLRELLKCYSLRFKFVSEVQAKRKLIYMGPVLDFSR